VLKEARNVKYGRFVAPGNHLRVEVDLSKATDGGGVFKAVGMVDGQRAVVAQIEVAYFNLADRQPELAEVDVRLREHNRRRWALVAPSAANVAMESKTA